MGFIFEKQEKYLKSEHNERVRYCFWHGKRSLIQIKKKSMPFLTLVGVPHRILWIDMLCSILLTWLLSYLTNLASILSYKLGFYLISQTWYIVQTWLLSYLTNLASILSYKLGFYLISQTWYILQTLASILSHKLTCILYLDVVWAEWRTRKWREEQGTSRRNRENASGSWETFW